MHFLTFSVDILVIVTETENGNRGQVTNQITSLILFYEAPLLLYFAMYSLFYLHNVISKAF